MPGPTIAHYDLAKFNDLEPFNSETAWTITQACKIMRGRGGKRLSIASAVRFANMRRGCFPQGREGVRLLLPTVKMCGELLTMESWVRAFEAARVRFGMNESRLAARRIADAIRTPCQRIRDDRLAAALLFQDGIGKGL